MSSKSILFSLRPVQRGMHLITDEVKSAIGPLPESGLLNLFVRHTSCGITINENYDPSVRYDMDKAFNRIAPENDTLYTHTDEGPDDMPSHVKSTLAGVSLTIPIVNGKLALGTWQGIYLCEFINHGGKRNFFATIIS